MLLVSHQQQCGGGVVRLEESTDGERLSGPCGVLSAQSPRLPRSVLGPRVPQVSLPAASPPAVSPLVTLRTALLVQC